MKVGIWGLYNNGNFGDDLMAVMFNTYIKGLGHEPSIYNVSGFLSDELGSKTYKSINEFVKENDVIIIGGGGMLVNNSLLKFLLKKNEFYFERSFYSLISALKRYRKKVIPISIGGDNSSSLNNPFKSSLFSQKYTLGGSVRLPSDLKLVDETIFSCLPDVVLSTSKFFNNILEKSLNQSTQKKRLILNLKNKSAFPLISVMRDAKIFELYDVFAFSSHAKTLADIGSYEYNIPDKTFSFGNIREGVDFIRSSDIVVSSKLHVGVTAMSFGIPFISFKGPNKAKEFLKNTQNEHFILDDPKSVIRALLNEPYNALKIDSNFRKYKEDSYLHFKKLSDNLAKL